MKQILLGLVLLCLIPKKHHAQFKVHPDSSFYTLTDSFYFNLLDDGSEGGLYNQMKRDKMSWGLRLFPSGAIKPAAKSFTKYAKKYNDASIPLPTLPSSTLSNITWTDIGPNDLITGVGQIQRIAFHPQYNGTTNQIIYAGSHYGGLFRSEDSGQNWVNWFTDRGLPITSVAGIAVSNTSVFVCTGNGDFGYDKFGYNGNYLTLGVGTINNFNPVHTQGVYKYDPSYPNKWVAINGNGSNSVTMIGGVLKNDLLDVFSEGGTMRNIMVHPTNDNIIFIATSLGIFRTTSGGNTWEQVLNFSNATDWRGIEFNPNNPNIVYASGRSVFESIDGGTTWTTLADANNLPTTFPPLITPERINLAVTPAAPHLLYAYSLGRNINTHVRSGTVMLYNRQTSTWSLLNTNPTANGRESYQPAFSGIAVSPINPNYVYTTNTKVWGVTPGGNWDYISSYNNSTFHADVHDLAFPPNSDDFIFAATHGGVSKKQRSAVGTGGWTRLYNGLRVGNVWAFDDWEGDPNIIVAAHQCVGSLVTLNRGQSWAQKHGGDGYGARIDDNTGLAFIKGNDISDFLRFNPLVGGVEHEITFLPPLLYPPFQGEQIQNAFAMINHPKTDEVYFGMNGLHKRLILEPTSSSTSNDVWERISDLDHYYPDDWNRRVMDIAISEDELTNITYLSTLSDFYVSEDNTALVCNPAPCFVQKTANFPVTPMPPATNTTPNPRTGIAIDPLNGNRVWVSTTGFDPNIKVLYSPDKGDTWINYDDSDGTLAKLNMPVNNIVYQRGTKDRLYIATDVGVYMREDADNGGKWIRFGENFPNVRTTELKINYCAGKLRAATFGRGTWETDLLPPEDNSTYRSFRIISSYEVWDTDKNMSRDIRIKAGGKLDLKNMTLNMPKDGVIIVEPGGELIADGTTITNKCDQAWQGIQVWGNTNLEQVPPSNQGFAIFNNCIIEHAKEALSPWQFGNFPNSSGTTGGTGGIIGASNTQFINNWRSAGFMKYRSPSGAIPEASFFIGCTFTVNDDYRSGFIGHISAWDVSGLRIKGCTFKDERTNKIGDPNTGGAYGIYTLEASPQITALQLGLYNPTYQRNTFEGLERAIEIGSDPTLFSSVIDQSDFIDNKRAVIVRADDGIKVIRNTFEIGGFQSNDSEYGLSLLRKGNFVVEQNTFSQSPNTGNWEPNIGLWIDDTKSNSNQIFNNDFNDLAFGNLAHGDNGNDLTTGFGGVQYLCNQNTNNALDFTLIKAAGASIGAAIADNQGEINQPALNTFSFPFNGAYFIDWHFSNDASRLPQVNYWTLPNTTNINEIPVDLINVLNQNANQSNTACNDNYTNPAIFMVQDQTGTTISLDELKENYYQANQQYQELVVTYKNRLDKGDTEAMLTKINTTPPQNKGVLKDELMATAPFLSDKALLSVAEAGLYNKIQLKEIIKANPDVILDEQFMNCLKDSCQTNLNNNDFLEIENSTATTLQANRVEFERTALLSQIGGQGRALTFWANEVIFNYRNDSLGPHSDSIETWIKHKPGLPAAYELIEHYWKQGRYNDVLTQFEKIPQHYALDEISLLNHLDYKRLKEMLHEAYRRNRTEATLERIEVDLLRTIADNNYGFAALYAANIVNFFYDYRYQYHPTLPNGLNPEGGRSVIGNNKSQEIMIKKVVNTPKIWGYPNPATTWADIVYQLPKTSQEAQLIISNTAGQLIQYFSLSKQEGVINLNTEDWTSGIYFVVIKTDQKTSNVLKLIIRN